jgi:hypothetical protein
MKTIIMIEQGRTQLVLQPENQADKEALAILQPRIENTSSKTYRDRYYQCAGGWTRHDAARHDLVIVFDQVAPLPVIDFE